MHIVLFLTAISKDHFNAVHMESSNPTYENIRITSIYYKKEHNSARNHLNVFTNNSKLELPSTYA